tara:strand:+ start:2640 stop:3278 length:639 start_codon:yes stop_codon:yes gene_type:complete
MAELYYSDELVKLYLGDWKDAVGLVNDIGAVVTDPPYGVSHYSGGKVMPNAVAYRPIVGDDDTDAVKDFFAWLPYETNAVVFGANYFPELLPHRGRWLCWDKRLSAKADRMFGSPFELAWQNSVLRSTKMFRCMHGGVVNANGRGKDRLHPTEKPIPMLIDVIETLTNGLVFDPFAGSGTTLSAAKALGRPSVGVEIDEGYCAAAAARLAVA